MIAPSENYSIKQGDQPIKVAVVGAGWFGRGLIIELVRRSDIDVPVVINRNIDRAIEALAAAGIPHAKIEVVDSVTAYKQASRLGKYIVSDLIELINDLKGIDCVYEATGDVLAGAQCAVNTINNGMHFITVNAEMDSTIGCILNKKAQEKGVIYSNSDGDQPGCLARMINNIKDMGFDVIVAGNCKGYLNVHKTPRDILPWVRPGHNPRMITSFTDGTKQSMEMTVLADAYGFTPDKRGMHGLETTKETIVDDFRDVIKKEGIVDYCLGINGIEQGGGVFVIAKRVGKDVLEDLYYLKKGVGPYYLFFRDYHICYFEAPNTVVEVVSELKPTIAPKTKMADVITCAKQDLPRGVQIDGIGGYTVYGVIDRAGVVWEENLVPVGLSAYSKTTQSIKKDTPITYTMVDFPEDNLVLQLRREQDELFSHPFIEKVS